MALTVIENGPFGVGGVGAGPGGKGPGSGPEDTPVVHGPAFGCESFQLERKWQPLSPLAGEPLNVQTVQICGCVQSEHFAQQSATLVMFWNVAISSPAPKHVGAVGEEHDRGCARAVNRTMKIADIFFKIVEVCVTARSCGWRYVVRACVGGAFGSPTLPTVGALHTCSDIRFPNFRHFD